MKIFIINGPNLNLLGRREPHIYGSLTFESYFEQLQKDFPGHQLFYFQSNHEGAIVDKLQEFLGSDIQGIVINPAAYTHTSITIADTLAAIKIPTIEVHISDIYNRESFRHFSFVKSQCCQSFVGFGLEGYRKAVEYLINITKNVNKK